MKGHHPLSKGDNSENLKIHYVRLKCFSPETRPISTKLGSKDLKVKGVVQSRYSLSGDNRQDLQNLFFSRNTRPISTEPDTKHSGI